MVTCLKGPLNLWVLSPYPQLSGQLNVWIVSPYPQLKGPLNLWGSKGGYTEEKEKWLVMGGGLAQKNARCTPSVLTLP